MWAANCLWSIGLALQRLSAHPVTSYSSCRAQVYSCKPNRLVIGSGQTPEAQCCLLCCSCNSAPSLGSFCWVLHCQDLLDCCSSSFFWAASSIHSCHMMWARGGLCSCLFLFPLFIPQSDIAQMHTVFHDTFLLGWLGCGICIGHGQALWVKIHCDGRGKVCTDSGISKILISLLCSCDPQHTGWRVCMTLASASMLPKFSSYHQVLPNPSVNQDCIGWSGWSPLDHSTYVQISRTSNVSNYHPWVCPGCGGQQCFSSSWGKLSWRVPLHLLPCGMNRKEVLLPMEEFLCHPHLQGVVSPWDSGGRKQRGVCLKTVTWKDSCMALLASRVVPSWDQSYIPWLIPTVYPGVGWTPCP